MKAEKPTHSSRPDSGKWYAMNPRPMASPLFTERRTSAASWAPVLVFLPGRAAALWECPLQLRLQQRLDVHLDEDLVADDHAAVLQLAVPADPEVVPVDARLPHEADPRDRTGVPCVGPERRSPLAQ